MEKLFPEVERLFYSLTVLMYSIYEQTRITNIVIGRLRVCGGNTDFFIFIKNKKKKTFFLKMCQPRK